VVLIARSALGALLGLMSLGGWAGCGGGSSRPAIAAPGGDAAISTDLLPDRTAGADAGLVGETPQLPDALSGGDGSRGAEGSPADATAAAPALPLRTRGRYIVDATGARVKLASVNWYGASDTKKVVGGLDTAPLQDIVAAIARLGFNSVRLPFANQLLRDRALDAKAVAANPDLAGLTPLEVYDRVVEALTGAGLLVVLNNHSTHFMWCCGLDTDGLWYGPDQSEAQWLDDWAQMVRRYRDNPMVVAADLRNEVRIPSWNPFLIPTWNGLTAPWRAAAERAAARVLAENPDLLVVVEGVNFPRDHLKGVRSNPVRLPLPDRLVYAAHNYGYIGPGLTGTKYGDMDWPTFQRQMDQEWGYVIEENQPYTAPVWVSEFGTGPSPSVWWTNIVRYLREGDFDFAYWALNPGPKASGEDEPFGLLQRDWRTPLEDARVRDLRSLVAPTRGPK
jgi:endoglucanase